MPNIEAGSSLSPSIGEPHPGVAQVREIMLQRLGALRHYAVAFEHVALANPDDDATIDAVGNQLAAALRAAMPALGDYRTKRNVKGIA